MTDIDVLLSASLKRLAPSGDAAGVADAIRARVDAGDTGTPAGTSGFGSRRWWALLLSALLVVVIGVVSVSVALGMPRAAVEPPTMPAVAATPTHTATPRPTTTPTPTPSAATPVITPEPVQPEPEPAPPAPPADTTAPVIQLASASPTPIYGSNGSDTTVSATVTDDTGVVAVTISWSGPLSGSSTMTPGWSHYFDTPPGTSAGQLTFTLQAFDAAGNASAPVQVVVQVVF